MGFGMTDLRLKQVYLDKARRRYEQMREKVLPLGTRVIFLIGGVYMSGFVSCYVEPDNGEVMICPDDQWKPKLEHRLDKYGWVCVAIACVELA